MLAAENEGPAAAVNVSVRVTTICYNLQLINNAWEVGIKTFTYLNVNLPKLIFSHLRLVVLFPVINKTPLLVGVVIDNRVVLSMV